MKDFFELSNLVLEEIEKDWHSSNEKLTMANENLKKALQGYDAAEEYFKELIKEKLKKLKREDSDFPPYYENLVDGIYHENWGYSGMAEWFEEKYSDISSAKVIGSRIYFLIDGSMKLMPQKISNNRRAQLTMKLLSIKPDERKDKDFHEIYMLDGTRITIYNESMCKKDEDAIIFRRYTVPTYTFEEQARRGTIASEMIPLFKKMVSLGYNVAFTGAVRTAKTTFLSTWQSYEDPTLEGVLVETDPEIPLHKIMPTAPILQIVTDGENLHTVSKRLMRSDADYIIMAEARDGVALDAAVRIANKGTRRCKMTFHNQNPQNFCYDAAREILKTEGGDLQTTAEWVASSIDYIFHFTQLKDKSKKRLESIHEINFNYKDRKIEVAELCRYTYEENKWNWHYHISDGKIVAGKKENETVFEEFSAMLKSLAFNL